MLWAWAEKRFLFFPDSQVDKTPAQAGLPYEDVCLTASDGVVLHGWFLPAPAADAGPETQTWLWFHGNGGNVGTRVGQLERAHHLLGVHQFIFDYRVMAAAKVNRRNAAPTLTPAPPASIWRGARVSTPDASYTSATPWARRWPSNWPHRNPLTAWP